MRNEDRLVDLLAESLKRQNRQTEILGKHSELLRKLVEGHDKLVYGFETLTSEFHKMNEHLLKKQKENV